MKKAIFFDIDGTLLDYMNGIVDITPKVKQAIHSLQEEGHYVFIATGRPYAFLSKSILDFGFDGFVLANGAHVIIKNKTIFSEYLDKSFVSNLVDELENLNIQYVLEGEYHSYMKECFKEFHDFYDTVGVSKELFKVNYSLDDIGIYKIEMMCPNDETVEKCLNIVQRNEDYDYVNSIALKSFELYSKKNTKATGIIKALEYLDIDINNSYAFGDGKNDIEMLVTVGCGIAMGNACDSIKKYANEITTSIHDDGVATGIERFILKK